MPMHLRQSFMCVRSGPGKPRRSEVGHDQIHTRPDLDWRYDAIRTECLQTLSISAQDPAATPEA